MPLIKRPMASPACSKMKPMTIKQEAIFTMYKIDHDETNRQSLDDWYVRCLAMKIIRDAGKYRGARPDANT